MTHGVFVTGTDTGVGKTVIAAALARAWDGAYWKPIQTGLAEDPGDTATVARLSGLPPDRLFPPLHTLAAPLSPHAAAEREGVRITLDSFVLPVTSRPLVVEGAGGLMVPLNESELIIDLIEKLGLPVVLVARSTLGTINHTLLSLAALRARGLPIAGVILNGALNPGNRAAIERFGEVKILAEVPWLDGADGVRLQGVSPPAPPCRTGVVPPSGTFSDNGQAGHVGGCGDQTFRTGVRPPPGNSPAKPIKCFTGVLQGVSPPAPPDPGTLIALDRRHVWHPFTQAKTAPEPIPIKSGRGASLFTVDGREIIDLISSWWVTLHGHAHPAIARAVAAQAERLEQVIFADFTHEPAVTLATRLAGVLPDGLDRVFFSDNGSTSVEVALKLSWQYWRNRGETRRRKFLAFEGGYHGDTFGAMAAGAGSGFYAPFHELLFEVEALPYPATWDGDPDIEAKEAASLARLDAWLDRHGPDTAALIIEPLVQGAAGMRMCRPEFLRALAVRLADEGVLLIFDEVMTGFGRTGSRFACQGAGVTPDLICLSKGLTGGFLPLSATVCRQELYEAFLGEGFDKAFAHGHSFTANPLGCAAALASLDLLETPETTARLAAIEARHRLGMARLSDHPGLTRARVLGTIAAIDVAGENGYAAAVGPRLKAFFRERGLLLRPLGNVIYLLPPYAVTDAQLDRAYQAIEEAADALA